MARFRVGEIFAESFRLTFQHFATFLRTQGVLVLALALVGLAFTLSVNELVVPQITEAVGGSTTDVEGIFAAMIPIVLGALLFGVVSIFIAPILYGVGLVVADRVRLGPSDVSLGEAWNAAKPRYGAMLGVIFIFIGIVLGGMIALGGLSIAMASMGPAGIILIFLLFAAAMVVFVWLLLRWFLVLPAALFEARGAGESLRRSSELTEGSRGAILGLLLLIVLTVGVPSGIVNSIISPSPTIEPGMTEAEAAAALQPSTTQTILSWIVSTAFQLVGSFVGALAMVLIYRRLAEPAQVSPAPGGIAMTAPPPPPSM